ncbi:hypothetical protein [Psychrobacillus vulpis]|uniref:Uncharacterized protein n=1 Tax=Psychrobacillus vulpis TaxID=2325572 RepID=A0A544TDH5_9BACI|nr:hypothetical protein [Psychrobacillus vulpis]TQR15517.1 hypothetical protein FG384_19230 [Psychrobacillus vulpis]
MLVTDEQFRENPFIFVQLEESIKIKRKIINQLELDIIICEEGRNKKLLEEKLTNAKNEIDQLIRISILNIDYANNDGQKLKFEPLTQEQIKENLKNNQEKLSLGYVRYYHYVLGINVNPKQILVSEVYENIRQTYGNQLEFLTNEANKEHIKEYKDYLKNIRKPFGEAIDNAEIDRYLELIPHIGSEISRYKAYVDGYENRAKISEDLDGG